MPRASTPQYLPGRPEVFLGCRAVSAPAGASMEAIGLAAVLRALICLSPVPGVLANRDGSPMTMAQIADEIRRGYTAETVLELILQVPELLQIDLYGSVVAGDLDAAAHRRRTNAANGAQGGRPKTAVLCGEKPKEPKRDNRNEEPNTGNPTSVPALASSAAAVLVPDPSSAPPLSPAPSPSRELSLPLDPPNPSPQQQLKHGGPLASPQEHPSGFASGVQEHRGNTAIQEHVRPASVPVQSSQGVADIDKQELRPSGPDESIVPMIKQAAAIAFGVWSPMQWVEALSFCGISLYPGGPPPHSAPRSIRDWIFAMQRKDWHDNDGRRINRWSHCEAIAHSWFQKWYEREKRLGHNPFDPLPGCPSCTKPGTSSSLGIIKAFADEKTGKWLKIAEARQLHLSGGSITTKTASCPYCQGRAHDPRQAKWLKQNGFPAYSDPSQFLSLISMESSREEKQPSAP